LLVARLSAEVRYCLASLVQPLEAVQRLNEVFCDGRWEGKFVTMVLAVIDVARHDVCIVNAGHMAPLLRRVSGTVAEVGESQGGFPLGIEAESSYQQISIPMAVGESLVMYTDGVLDAENRQGDRYGTERLIANLQRPSANVTEMGQAVIGEVKRFIGDHPQVDDICLTAVRRIQ
jgi:serine phosphatase RsbU (regulator of sigma subunit)